MLGGLSLAEMGGTLTPQALGARLGEPFGGGGGNKSGPRRQSYWVI